jgi:hypothetical protein
VDRNRREGLAGLQDGRQFQLAGGNATGMYVLVNALVAKQLEVLREVVPGATTVAFIDNPTNPLSELRLR